MLDDALVLCCHVSVQHGINVSILVVLDDALVHLNRNVNPNINMVSILVVLDDALVLTSNVIVNKVIDESQSLLCWKML